MPKTTRKPVNLETILKSLIKTLNLPAKKDIDRLVDQMNQLEKLLRKTTSSLTLSGKAGLPKNASRKKGQSSRRSRMTASSVVLEVISASPSGADFKEIQDRTGFEEKKIRNIIFRLNKIKKITRKNRGTYVAIN